jgi:predicted outer membrane protein
MLIRFSAAIAVVCLLGGAAFAQAGPKPADPQIAHIVSNEFAYHKTVNGALENTLIPSATNPELKSLLQTGLKLFQDHEQHAEHVASELK